jgi:hypothetical protein
MIRLRGNLLSQCGAVNQNSRRAPTAFKGRRLTISGKKEFRILELTIKKGTNKLPEGLESMSYLTGELLLHLRTAQSQEA